MSSSLSNALFRYFHWYLYGGSQSPPQKVHPEDSEEHVRMHYAAACELPAYLFPHRVADSASA